MEFKTKLKVRLWVAIAYMLIGLGMIAIFNLMENGNEYLSTLGLILVVMGIARWRNYRRITKSEESVKEQQIRETDERNVAIVEKAKGIAFNAMVLLLGIAIIVLNFMELTAYMQVLFYVLCALVGIYWISYLVIRKCI